MTKPYPLIIRLKGKLYLLSLFYGKYTLRNCDKDGNILNKYGIRPKDMNRDNVLKFSN